MSHRDGVKGSSVSVPGAQNERVKDMNFAFIKGLYDTLDLFSEELSAALEKAGHNCIFLTATDLGKSLPSFIEYHAIHHIDAVIAFNNLGYNLGTKEGGNLWDALQILYVDILMDHPFHFDRQLQNLPKKNLLFVIDKNHVDYVERYYDNVNRTVFLPHAGCANAISAAAENNAISAAAKNDATSAASQTNAESAFALRSGNPRDIDILYAGALSRVLIESLIPDFDSIKEFDGALFSKRCLDRLINEPSVTTEECIRQELSNEGLSSIPIERERELITDFRFLDGYACSFFREQAVRVLCENGFKVSALGLGWEQCDWADNENLVILGKVGAKEVFPYMLRSKIVLNTLTWFKAGSHDRIPNGMLAGAAVVTDDSDYLREAFKNGECVRFPLSDIMKLPETVDELLSDEPRRKALSGKGYDSAVKNHTWEQRAKSILASLAD